MTFSWYAEWRSVLLLAAGYVVKCESCSVDSGEVEIFEAIFHAFKPRKYFIYSLRSRLNSSLGRDDIMFW